MELPEDIRREVAMEYGVELPFDITKEEEKSQLTLLSQKSLVSSQVSTVSDTGSAMTCMDCGNFMSSWLQHDHERWPRTGVPPRYDDGDEWELEDDEDDDHYQGEED